MNAIIPIPRISVTTRPATMDDLSFIDGLQRIHTKQVGWMPTAQFEGKIKAGHVLVAQSGETTDSTDITDGIHSSVPSVTSVVQPLGYCIGHDQYFKRDDVGIIYQMNVVPGRQRGFVGATLLKAMFDRAAYGCRLFCCWCAQDIEANYFWESLGFVPLAFRAGSAKKSRVHIFWQKRIREGDTTTPYWFPAQTNSGSIREDRLVLPIPPGTHWRDAKPIVLPGQNAECGMMKDESPKALGHRRSRRGNDGAAPTPQTPTKQRLQFGRPGMKPAPVVEVAPKAAVDQPKPKKQKTPRVKVKNDPKLVAAARELRDRWLEHANAHPEALISQGKYSVSRALPSGSGGVAMPGIELIDATPVLPALPMAA